MNLPAHEHSPRRHDAPDKYARNLTVPGRRRVGAVLLSTVLLGGLLLAPGVVLLAVPGTCSAADGNDANPKQMIGTVTDVARNLRLSGLEHPIDVRADRMELDYRGGSLIYKGNVEVRQGPVTMNADDVVVTFTTGEKRKLREIRATGRVHVARGPESATGGKAVFNPEAATITLSDGAKLGSGPNTLTGDRIVVYLNKQKATVLGGPASPRVDPGVGGNGKPEKKQDGRVRVVIVPDSIDGLNPSEILE